jgi:HD superfamily phosphohydrolase
MWASFMNDVSLQGGSKPKMNDSLDTFERKIVWLSKGWHNEKSNLEAVIKLFSDVYGWGEDIYYSVMYRKLLKVLLKTCSENQLEFFFGKIFDNHTQIILTGDFSIKNNAPVTIEMMVKMMISQLASLRICANNDEVLIDIELPEDDPMTSFIKQRQMELHQ